MTVVAANQIIKAQRPRHRKKIPIAASIVIYEGTLVYITATGFATNVDANGANKFGGIATGYFEGGSTDGERACEVFTRGSFELPFSGLTQANLGDKCYGDDNWLASVTSTNNTYIGTLDEFVSATAGRVDIDTQTP